MKHWREHLLLAVCISILGISAYQLAKIYLTYQEGAEEYENLQEYVEEVPTNTDGEESDPESPGETEVVIDFDELKKINPDIVAWLRIEGTAIDYPVVQGDDNDYYLKHTFRKEAHIAGSIFLDYRNNPDFTDGKMIIYGHNMKDGSMFHSLREFKEKSYLDGHPEMKLYFPSSESRVYEIMGCETVSATGETYVLNRGREEEYQELILSTCSSTSNQRLVVWGILREGRLGSGL